MYNILVNTELRESYFELDLILWNRQNFSLENCCTRKFTFTDIHTKKYSLSPILLYKANNSENNNVHLYKTSNTVLRSFNFNFRFNIQKKKIVVYEIIQAATKYDCATRRRRQNIDINNIRIATFSIRPTNVDDVNEDDEATNCTKTPLLIAIWLKLKPKITVEKRFGSVLYVYGEEEQLDGTCCTIN